MRHESGVALAAVVVSALLGVCGSAVGDPGDEGVPCPLSPTPAEALLVLDRMAIGLYDAPQARGLPDILVPVTVHVIRHSDGWGGLSEAAVEQAMDSANALWQGSGIQFCRPGATIYHDSDELYYNTDTLAELNAMRTLDPVPATINVYFANNPRYELGGLCGISSFTFSSTQGIVMSNACVPSAGNPSTFAHELGHYFDLFHTHENALGNECTDGSNCDVAGDLLCDTPADPNISGEVNPSECLWGGSHTPTCGTGVPYDPSPRNLLSYSAKTCRDELTAGQKSRAYATLVNLRPDLLANACDPCPNIADVNDDDALTPADFSAWIGAFNADSPSADQNADGLVTAADFSAWIVNYNKGCQG